MDIYIIVIIGVFICLHIPCITVCVFLHFAVEVVLSLAMRSELPRGEQRETGGGEKERHSQSDLMNFVPSPHGIIVTKRLLE